MSLARWYEDNGRHDLAWRATRDPWLVLVSEVMLQQTQVARIAVAWPEFIARFPTPQAMADAGPGAVIEAWGRLGYPRRARRLWETAVHIAADGWPDDLTELPGVGRYTAAALRCLADDADVPAVEVNVRRVVERVTGKRLTEREAEAAMVAVGKPLRGRDRLLALMDIGATCAGPTTRNAACARSSVAARRAARSPRQPGRVSPRSKGRSASGAASCCPGSAPARRRWCCSTHPHCARWWPTASPRSTATASSPACPNRGCVPEPASRA